MRIEYETKAQGPVLAEYSKDRSSVSVIIGPLGSGKTFQTCHKIFDLICEQKPNAQNVRLSRWYAIRNTYPDLMTTTAKDWLELFGELGRFTKGGMEPPTHHIKFKLPDGTTVKSELIFLALDREDAVKKLRGAQATGFWLNEVKELHKSIVDMADLRHGRYPSAVDGGPSWHGMLADSNAPDEDHWLYKIAEEERPEGWSFFKQPGGVKKAGVTDMGKVKWVPNPEAENLNNLPPDYYTRGVQGKKDDWVSVNLANEYGFVTDGKPVFPEYSDNAHCREFDFVEGVPIYRGWDFGVPACVLAQLTPKGRLVVRTEFTSHQTMGIDRFSDDVLNECAVLKNTGYEFIDVGDPAGNARAPTDEKTCFNILRDKGINIHPGTQDPTSRQEAVRYFLSRMIEGLPAFLLHPECKIMRKGFQGGYCLRRIQTAGERFTDKPDKHNPYSHIQDALQYVCTFIRSGYDQFHDDEYDPEYEHERETCNNITGY